MRSIWRFAGIALSASDGTEKGGGQLYNYMFDKTYSVELYWPEITLLIADAEDWARRNETLAYRAAPGPDRDVFMREAIDLQGRANQLKRIMETQTV